MTKNKLRCKARTKSKSNIRCSNTEFLEGLCYSHFFRGTERLKHNKRTRLCFRCLEPYTQELEEHNKKCSP